MSDFVYLYRLPANSPHMPDSPQQLQERLQKWTVWLKGLEAKNNLVSIGHPLESGGSVVRDKRGTVTDGPYAESKDIVIGYALITARDLTHAQELASGCPIFEAGGSVEVRPIRKM